MKSIVTEMKMHWTGSTAYLIHRKEPQNLKIDWDYSVWVTKGKVMKKKWTDPQKPVGHHQAYQHTHTESPKRKRGRKYNWRNKGQKLPKFDENIKHLWSSTNFSYGKQKNSQQDTS